MVKKFWGVNPTGFLPKIASQRPGKKFSCVSRPDSCVTWRDLSKSDEFGRRRRPKKFFGAILTLLGHNSDQRWGQDGS